MKALSFPATIVVKFKDDSEKNWETIGAMFESGEMQLEVFANNTLNNEWHPVIIVSEPTEEDKIEEITETLETEEGREKI